MVLIDFDLQFIFTEIKTDATLACLTAVGQRITRIWFSTCLSNRSVAMQLPASLSRPIKNIILHCNLSKKSCL